MKVRRVMPAKGAVPRFAADLAALHAASFTSPPPWSAQAFAAHLVDPACLCHSAADARGTICGFILTRRVLDEAEILTIAVGVGSRGRGIGQRLLTAALDDLAARGAESVFLEVAENNASARALYARAGFVRAGRRKGYFTHGQPSEPVDALILRRAMR